MNIIRDHKRRPYNILEVSASYTVMECLLTGDRVKLSNSQSVSMGFTVS